MKITKADKTLIIAVITLSVLGMVFVNFFVYSATPAAAVIEVDGKPYARYNFNEIEGTKVVNINTEFGRNTLEIQKDKAIMTDASCPDKIDVHQGYIYKTGHTIICIPNRVVVRIEGGSPKNSPSVDKVTY